MSLTRTIPLFAIPVTHLPSLQANILEPNILDPRARVYHRRRKSLRRSFFCEKKKITSTTGPRQLPTDGPVRHGIPLKLVTFPLDIRGSRFFFKFPSLPS